VGLLVDGTINPQTDYIEEISKDLGRNWPALAGAKAAALEVQGVLGKCLVNAFGSVTSSDVDVVAFGSLARREWTSGSDVDYSDGRFLKIREISHRFQAALDAVFFAKNTALQTFIVKYGVF
jgi:hypothetical protein